MTSSKVSAKNPVKASPIFIGLAPHVIITDGFLRIVRKSTPNNLYPLSPSSIQHLQLQCNDKEFLYNKTAGDYLL